MSEQKTMQQAELPTLESAPGEKHSAVIARGISMPAHQVRIAIEQAVACLKEIPFIKGITQEETYLLRARTDGGEEENAQVLREMITRGIPVCDFHRAPMNLEKVFMEVTGDA